MLPVIKNNSTWESLQLYHRKAETRTMHLLSEFNRFGIRLAKHSNALSHNQQLGNANAGQDYGYWTSEYQRWHKDVMLSLQFTITLLAILTTYPFSLQYPELYLSPDSQQSNDIITDLLAKKQQQQQQMSTTTTTTTSTLPLSPQSALPLASPDFQSSTTPSSSSSTIPSNLIASPETNTTTSITTTTTTTTPDVVPIVYIEPNAHGQFPPLPRLNLSLVSLSPAQLSHIRRSSSIMTDLTSQLASNIQLCRFSLQRLGLLYGIKDDPALRPSDDHNGIEVLNSDTDQEGGHSSVPALGQSLLHSDHTGRSELLGTSVSTNQQNQYFAGEQREIQESLLATESVLYHAHAAQASLNRQLDVFQSMKQTLEHSLEYHFPSIFRLTSAIQSRQHRENLLLATLVAFLIFISFLYIRH